MSYREYACEKCLNKKERLESSTGIYGKMECCGKAMVLLVSVFARTAKKWEV